MKLFKDRNRTLLFYVLYWIFYFIFFTVYRSSIEIVQFHSDMFDAVKLSLLFNITLIPFPIIAALFISEIILPFFILERKWFLFTLIVIAVTLIGPAFLYFPLKFIVNPYIINEEWNYNISNYFAASMKFVYCLVPLLWYKITKNLNEKELDFQRTFKEKFEAELKLRDTELKLLRSQIQPHFLFNTLNNLYSLSLEKSEKTSEIIIRLSELLSYITYDCNSEKVSLEKEITFLRSFIELEKLRYDKSLQINFLVSGDCNDKYIAPMILHTFVENSFKHGASKDTGNSRIDINLTLNDNWLNFSVSNSRVIENDKQETGIGIENARRRLQLLYPNRHSLEIVSNRSTFNVFLEIQL